MSSLLDTSMGPATRRPLTQAQISKRKESRRAASERYRERHRERVLEEGRARAARHRAALKMKGEEGLQERARERAREASARYRARNRLELALKQRKVRKAAYIKKYGAQAYVQRRYGDPAPTSTSAPAPVQDDEPEDDDSDDGDNRGWNEYSAPRICDYVDPCLRRG
ncbi:hypothetical protein C8F04DRAFT_1264289 [Mycena alexandri]|uniref:Uncharacterized protein n=1 Tax=Mycena alexandri TaxID=1745969 RepID=A0AAD6X067_9AGAR|nr:hypothetical protein C8F04DRAFT_1264289 [Mycena alexandri]